MTVQWVKIPDIGGATDVEVIEVNVNVGDTVEKDDTILVLESDKATMEIPCPESGTIDQISISVGDKVSEGDNILSFQGGVVAGAANNGTATPVAEETPAPTETPAANPEPEAPVAETASSASEDVCIPDIGGAEGVEIIEVGVAVGDQIEEEQTLIVLESDKSTMEIPSPKGGMVESLSVSVGDKVSEGDKILVLKTESSTAPKAAPASAPAPSTAASTANTPAPAAAPQPAKAPATADEPVVSSGKEHAGPAVRKLAREFGIELKLVKGTGPKGRILKEDLQAYVKNKVSNPAPAAGGAGLAVSPMPNIDYSKFGDVEIIDLNRIKKATAKNLHRSWVTLPHVTQFDEADITELETYRKTTAKEMAPEGVKITLLAFLLKACAKALKEHPRFNSALSPDGEQLILKKYINIGIAVETPDGLVVPVVKDVDKKSIVEIAANCSTLAKQAREKKLPLDAMQGGCFSISSLGGIGGTAFTPIVNAPEVAILGVSRAKMAPIYMNGEFVPRLMAPLSLSYDHRVIDGADGARFTTYLSTLLSDIRNLLL